MLVATAQGVLRAGSRVKAVRLLSASAKVSAASASEAVNASPTKASPTSSSPVPEAFRAPARPTFETNSTSSSRPGSGLGRSHRIGGRVHSYFKLHVSSTRNNTILTLTHTPGAQSFDQDPDQPHHVVAWVSGGSAGFKGASRATYDAAVEASIRMFKKIDNLISPPVVQGNKTKVIWSPPTDLEIIWKGFGQGRDAVYRTLMGGQGESIQRIVKRVTDATPLKIGGTRPKKKRTI
ncbi:hypothetical protein OIV83_001808 [Microbotryomycetes sp. JL201]|nr:hypothetical protein OIV83_001808 [Microbotryomycetes sp. JL201]